jgi:toxin ParE1/3/4
MTFKIIYTDKAEHNLEEIAFYIATDNPMRAVSFVLELRAKITMLRHFPMLYQKQGRNRRLVYGNYIVIYRVNETQKRISILRVFEGHKRVA